MSWSLEWELQDEIETALEENAVVEAMFADGHEVPALVDLGEWIAFGEVPAVQIAQALESGNWEPIYKAFSYAWAEAKAKRIEQNVRDAEEHIALVRSL